MVIPEAEDDLTAALQWYDARSDMAGAHLLLRVNDAVAQIIDRPLTFPLVFGDVRRALVHRFPFAVYFTLDGPSVVVLAIFHGARQWRERLRKRLKHH